MKKMFNIDERKKARLELERQRVLDELNAIEELEKRNKRETEMKANKRQAEKNYFEKQCRNYLINRPLEERKLGVMQWIAKHPDMTEQHVGEHGEPLVRKVTYADLIKRFRLDTDEIQTEPKYSE